MKSKLIKLNNYQEKNEYTDLSKNTQLLANERFVDGDIISEKIFFLQKTSKNNRRRNFSYYNEISLKWKSSVRKFYKYLY